MKLGTIYADTVYNLQTTYRSDLFQFHYNWRLGRQGNKTRNKMIYKASTQLSMAVL